MKYRLLRKFLMICTESDPSTTHTHSSLLQVYTDLLTDVLIVYEYFNTPGLPPVFAWLTLVIIFVSQLCQAWSNYSNNHVDKYWEAFYGFMGLSMLFDAIAVWRGSEWDSERTAVGPVEKLSNTKSARVMSNNILQVVIQSHVILGTLMGDFGEQMYANGVSNTQWFSLAVGFMCSGSQMADASVAFENLGMWYPNFFAPLHDYLVASTAVAGHEHNILLS